MPVEDVRGRIKVNKYLAGSSLRDEHFQRKIDSGHRLRQHKRRASSRIAKNYQRGRRHRETSGKRLCLLVYRGKDFDLMMGECRRQSLYGLSEWIGALNRHNASVDDVV